MMVVNTTSTCVVGVDCVLVSCQTYIMKRRHKNKTWFDLQKLHRMAFYARIKVILNLVYQKVIEVADPVVPFERICL